MKRLPITRSLDEPPATRGPSAITLVLIAALLAVLVAPTGPAGADEPTTFTGREVFVDLNPCSGELHQLTIDVVARVHLTHPGVITGSVDRTGFSDSGFVMHHGGSQFVDNGHVSKTTLNDNWVNHETGQRFRASFVVVFNAQTGVLQVDSFVILRCLGPKLVSTPG